MSDETGDGSNPQEDAPDAGPSSGSVRNRNFVIVLALILVLSAVTALVYWFFIRDTRPDVWEDATVPYDEASCAEDGACEVYAIGAAGHGGHDPDAATQFIYNPAIDDEIAQWGDCLGSVYTCIETGFLEAAETGATPDDAAIIASCVAAADCPDECKTRFAQRSRGRDADGLEALFVEMFVDERGYCVPREADQ